MRYNADFRYDLECGIRAERWLGQILEASKIEVKRDFKAASTKRVFVEYESREKPSGIAVSEADYWAFILDAAVVLVDRVRLKGLVDSAIAEGRVITGGDKNRAKGVLIALGDLLTQPPDTRPDSHL